MRELISVITVTPTSDGGNGGPSIEFEGDLAAMLAVSQNRRDIGGGGLPLPFHFPIKVFAEKQNIGRAPRERARRCVA